MGPYKLILIGKTSLFTEKSLFLSKQKTSKEDVRGNTSR